MQKFGCLLLLMVLGWMCLELYVVLELVLRFEDAVLPIAAVVALSIIGWKLVQFHKNRMMVSFAQGQAGSRIIGMLGAVLIVIPGFISGFIGLLLQIPFIQRLFASLGNKIMASMMKRFMGGGFPGAGFPGAGFPGGFPGGMPKGGFPGFPGMMQRPDERISMPKAAPKTYDVKPEKE
jgi:UPF0716 family protein affecting phage T7 exclusion